MSKDKDDKTPTDKENIPFTDKSLSEVTEASNDACTETYTKHDDASKLSTESSVEKSSVQRLDIPDSEKNTSKRQVTVSSEVVAEIPTSESTGRSAGPSTNECPSAQKNGTEVVLSPMKRSITEVDLADNNGVSTPLNLSISPSRESRNDNPNASPMKKRKIEARDSNISASSTVEDKVSDVPEALISPKKSEVANEQRSASGSSESPQNLKNQSSVKSIQKPQQQDHPQLRKMLSQKQDNPLLREILNREPQDNLQPVRRERDSPRKLRRKQFSPQRFRRAQDCPQGLRQEQDNPQRLRQEDQDSVQRFRQEEQDILHRLRREQDVLQRLRRAQDSLQRFRRAQEGSPQRLREQDKPSGLRRVPLDNPQLRKLLSRVSVICVNPSASTEKCRSESRHSTMRHNRSQSWSSQSARSRPKNGSMDSRKHRTQSANRKCEESRSSEAGRPWNGARWVENYIRYLLQQYPDTQSDSCEGSSQISVIEQQPQHETSKKSENLSEKEESTSFSNAKAVPEEEQHQDSSDCDTDDKLKSDESPSKRDKCK